MRVVKDYTVSVLLFVLIGITTSVSPETSNSRSHYRDRNHNNLVMGRDGASVSGRSIFSRFRGQPNAVPLEDDGNNYLDREDTVPNDGDVEISEDESFESSNEDYNPTSKTKLMGKDVIIADLNGGGGPNVFRRMVNFFRGVRGGNGGNNNNGGTGNGVGGSNTGSGTVLPSSTNGGGGGNRNNNNNNNRVVYTTGSGSRGGACVCSTGKEAKESRTSANEEEYPEDEDQLQKLDDSSQMLYDANESNDDDRRR